MGLFLLSVGSLAVAPLFMHAMHGNATSRDLGWVGVSVEQRIEILRSMPYDSLVPGGSVTTAVSGYTDNPEPDVEIRWTIVDHSSTIPGTKIITVRGIRDGPQPRARGQVTSITVRGD